MIHRKPCPAFGDLIRIALRRGHWSRARPVGAISKAERGKSQGALAQLCEFPRLLIRIALRRGTSSVSPAGCHLPQRGRLILLRLFSQACCRLASLKQLYEPSPMGPEPAAACGGRRQAERRNCKGALARPLRFPGSAPKGRMRSPAAAGRGSTLNKPACCRRHHRQTAVNLDAPRPRPKPCGKIYITKRIYKSETAPAQAGRFRGFSGVRHCAGSGANRRFRKKYPEPGRNARRTPSI